MTASEEDSLSVVICPPTTQQPKQEKQLLKDLQLKYTSQHNRLDIYLAINKIYLQNLINRRQRSTIPPQLKQVLGQNCILYKQIQIDENHTRQFLGPYWKNNPQIKTLKGNVHILYTPQYNMEVKIYFKDRFIQKQDHMWMTLHYISLGTWRSKNLSISQSLNNKHTCKIPVDDLNDYMEPNFLVNLTIKKQQKSESQNLGLINLGNTCYMNSCLQMMFYIRPLRKTILQEKSKNKIIIALKEIFIKLMDIQEKRPVDPEILLQSYEKFNQIPRRQQDVQQFLLDFINQLEKQCSGLKNLWQGKCSETTRSKQQGKPYKSTLEQEFCQLDVHMFNQKNEYFKTIEESLQSLLLTEDVEQTIDNQQYGRIQVEKYRKYENLPDVLFINLKRYQFNKEKLRLSKIFSHIQYGYNLNLSFLLQQTTPGKDKLGEDESTSNPQFDYSLYSVIVHKGSSPHNGHYFAFVNISNQPDVPRWFEFNDSVVRPSDTQEVLKFTGKKTKDVILDRNEGRYIERQIQSDQSCYLLVYIRKNVFYEYQKLQTPIPPAYLKQKMKKKAQQQKKNLQQVNILILPSQLETQTDLFAEQIQFTSIPLPQDSSVLMELQKIQSTYLACKIYKLYKVNIRQKKIKEVYEYDELKDILTFKRGHISFDYLLIVTEENNYFYRAKNTQNKMLIQDEIDQRTMPMETQHWGIMKVCWNELADEVGIPKYSHISLSQLMTLQSKIQQKGGRINYKNDKQDFQFNWNLYIEVQILKTQDGLQQTVTRNQYIQ